MVDRLRVNTIEDGSDGHPILNHSRLLTSPTSCAISRSTHSSSVMGTYVQLAPWTHLRISRSCIPSAALLRLQADPKISRYLPHAASPCDDSNFSHRPPINIHTVHREVKAHWLPSGPVRQTSGSSRIAGRLSCGYVLAEWRFLVLMTTVVNSHRDPPEGQPL